MTLSKCCNSDTSTTSTPVARDCASLMGERYLRWRSNEWAKTVLDNAQTCMHVTHASTALRLVGAIGSKQVLNRTDVAAIDCGYVGVGSLVFSHTNIGAVGVVTEEDCDQLTVTIISQRTAVLTPEYAAALAALETTVSDDSLGEFKDKYNALLAVIKGAFTG